MARIDGYFMPGKLQGFTAKTHLSKKNASTRHL
jgi:hypothetical protein